MQIRDTGLGYGIVTLIMHWIGAIAMISTVLVGLYLSWIATDKESSDMLFIHASVGSAIFLLSSFRVYWRWRHYQPLPLGAVSPIAVMIARAIAMGLLLAGVMLPLIGWFAVYTSARSVEIFGFYLLPSLAMPMEPLAGVVMFFHQLGAYVFIAGLLLHIFGGLKHHIVMKDKTLTRMLGEKVEL